MSIHRIEKLVLQLDYNWFLGLKDYFKKEQSFNTKTGTLHDYSHEETEEIDFKSYCWSCVGPGDYPDEYFVSRMDASDISCKVLDEIKQLVEKIQDVAVAHKIILAAIEAIGNSIEILRSKCVPEDEEFVAVLDHFFKQTTKGISNEHRHVKQAFIISTEHKETLKFDLNQEELAALLYILYDAGFIHTPTPTDTTFLNFCMDYFYFNNQKKKKHTPPTKLRAKFNDIKNGESQTAKEKVVARLKAVFKS